MGNTVPERCPERKNDFEGPCTHRKFWCGRFHSVLAWTLNARESRLWVLYHQNVYLLLAQTGL